MAVPQKDPKSVTYKDVEQSLELSQVNQIEDMNAFNLAGQKPDSLMNHNIAETYTLLGVTPEQFMKEHGADTFDFAKLREEFSKICDDYNGELVQGQPSYALQFCALVLYKIAPASRQVKAKTGDKTWVLKFCYNVQDKLVVKTCFVSTYKAEGAEYATDVVSENKLRVSVKHASLLAIVTLEKMVKYALGLTPPVVLLTPLSGAIFSRDDIVHIVNETQKNPRDVINMINASCQSGGQYLENSRLYIAAPATITATAGLRAKGKGAMANSILTKTIKQYLAQKKDNDEEEFVRYSRFATGGIPKGMEAKTLIELYKAAKDANFSQVKAISVARGLSDTELVARKEEITGEYMPLVRKTSDGRNILMKIKKPPTAEDVKKRAGISKMKKSAEQEEDED